jgi:hypothetical protein
MKKCKAGGKVEDGGHVFSIHKETPDEEKPEGSLGTYFGGWQLPYNICECGISEPYFRHTQETKPLEVPLKSRAPLRGSSWGGGMDD